MLNNSLQTESGKGIFKSTEKFVYQAMRSRKPIKMKKGSAAL